MTAPSRRSPRAARPRKPGRLILVLGGADSGKSQFAIRLCGRRSPRAFLATCQPADPEMRERVRRHQEARYGQWDAVEIPLALAGWFEASGARYRSILLDCLTLWLANLQADGQDSVSIIDRAQELLDAMRAVPARVVVVSNEVGWGIVPRNAMARQFRSLAGKINQQFAHAADEVYVTIGGLPLKLK